MAARTAPTGLPGLRSSRPGHGGMWACRPTRFGGGPAGIATIFGRLLAAPTTHHRPDPCTTAPVRRAGCPHPAKPGRRNYQAFGLQRSAGVRQEAGTFSGGYIIRPYMHAPPFPVVGACKIPLPYYLFPHTKKIRLAFASRIFLCWRYLSSRAVTRKVLSAKVSLTSVFGMGTGGPSPQSTPTASRQILYPSLRRKRQSSVIPLSLLSKSQTLRWFVILSSKMYPEN